MKWSGKRFKGEGLRMHLRETLDRLTVTLVECFASVTLSRDSKDG